MDKFVGIFFLFLLVINLVSALKLLEDPLEDEIEEVRVKRQGNYVLCLS